MNTITLAISNGMAVFTPLYWLFGKCMGFLLEILGNNYFISLLIFTILTRLVLLPFNLHQQKTMAKTTRIQPKLQKIQKRYPDPKDRMKMNEEIQALYAREGHNPMQIGCGPLVFQMVFLMGVIGIIYYPLQYIIGIPLTEISDSLVTALQNEFGKDLSFRYFQLELLANWDKYLPVIQDQFKEYFTPDKIQAIETYRNGLTVFGIDLTQVPQFTFKSGPVIIVPILAFLSSMASTVVSTLAQKKNNPAAQQQGSMMMMMLVMPFFSLYIAFQVTAAVGIYWVISNIIALFQQLFISKFFPPRKSQAKLMIENTIQRRAREATIKKIK